MNLCRRNAIFGFTAFVWPLSVRGQGEKESAGEAVSIPNEHIYGKLLGKKVVLDAMVWHRDKGISGRIVLPSGDSVYVEKPWMPSDDGIQRQRLPQGKLVRLVGVLSVRQMGKAPEGAQGYSHPFHYLSFNLESFKEISKADFEFPQISK
jgi:hypothetical protein